MPPTSLTEATPKFKSSQTLPLVETPLQGREMKQKGLLPSQKQINNISRLSVKKVIASQQQQTSHTSTKKLTNQKDESTQNVIKENTQASEDVSE